VLAQIAAHLRELRLGANLTQKGLANRAGVPYASLRAFERTGRISLLSFVKLCQTFNKDGALLAALAPSPLPYTSIQDVVEATAKPTSKRGRLA
jgi:transcriptional regulator with XRE-family HTH domain